MEVIVKNGIKIASFDNYAIYQMYTEDAEEYYMCTPIDDSQKYKMIIDFPEEYYKYLLKEETITEIIKICNKLYQKNSNYLYILTNVTTYELNEAQNENDEHAYQVLLKKIQRFTYNTYKAITTSNQNAIIDPVIDIVSQTNSDIKFIDWLDINLNGLFHSVPLDNIHKDTIEVNSDSGWTTKGGPNGGSESISETKANVKIKKLITPSNKHGHISIIFITAMIIIALIAGICLKTFILNK